MKISQIRQAPFLAIVLGLSALAFFFALRSQPSNAANNSQAWPSYGGNPENTHFSALKQIKRGGQSGGSYVAFALPQSR